MSTPLEHDYIGLSEPSLLERSSDKISSSSSSSTVCTNDEKANVVNLKETELRLGLPGLESPEKKADHWASLFGKDLEDKTTNGYNLSPLKNFISGSKRGFSDAIYVTGKWDLSINGGSGLDLSKGENLFSPKGSNGSSKNSSILQSCLPEPAAKEVGPPTPKPVQEKKTTPANEHSGAPAPKAQVVGWPPIRSFRKNTLATNLSKNTDVEGKSGSSCLYIKVSMDGAPYLRKVDLKTYCNYVELSSALEKMFSCFTIGQCTSHGSAGQEGFSESRLMDLLHGSEYVLTYEDKDGDWMLVGDVPWEMFMDSCKRLRIMRSTDAIGLAPKSMQKCKNQN